MTEAEVEGRRVGNELVTMRVNRGLSMLVYLWSPVEEAVNASLVSLFLVASAVSEMMG